MQRPVVEVLSLYIYVWKLRTISVYQMWTRSDFAFALWSCRNLSKPIAVQSKEKEDRYVDNYRVGSASRVSRAHRMVVSVPIALTVLQYLEEEYRKGIREDDPMPPVQPYHYGSHYSNSGTVLHFLVRMPPFTKMFLAYQGESLRALSHNVASRWVRWTCCQLFCPPVRSNEKVISSSCSSLIDTCPPSLLLSSPFSVNLLALILGGIGFMWP